ncbi:MAG: hypothetical protein FWH38_03165 [Treponema sp.]|nr:hypothetical protein [Treponema sp.]
MKKGRQRKIIIRLMIGALILFAAIVAEFFIHRYRVNRSVTFKTEENVLQMRRDGKWQDFALRGVTFDSGGRDMAKTEYARLIRDYASKETNVIRVYSIQQPEFYQAFFEYNVLTGRPVYLLHGIGLEDTSVESANDAYDDRLNTDYFEAMRNTIDVIHGKAAIKTGTYNINISPYVMGFIVCRETGAGFIKATNEKNTQIMGFEGDYLYTVNASPYEAWLAAAGNYAVFYECDKYHSSCKILTYTDIPGPGEQEADVDYEHIRATEKFDTGFFIIDEE